MFLSFYVLDDFFRFSKKLSFWVFLVHPTVVSVLLSASVERCFVSRMRDFKVTLPTYFFSKATLILHFKYLICTKINIRNQQKANNEYIQRERMIFFLNSDVDIKSNKIQKKNLALLFMVTIKEPFHVWNTEVFQSLGFGINNLVLGQLAMVL